MSFQRKLLQNVPNLLSYETLITLLNWLEIGVVLSSSFQTLESSLQKYPNLLSNANANNFAKLVSDWSRFVYFFQTFEASLQNETEIRF